MATEPTSSTDEDHMMWLKTLEKASMHAVLDTENIQLTLFSAT